MNRLINKTLLYYAILAMIGLLLSTPIFYLMLQRAYKAEVEESLHTRKLQFDRLRMLNDNIALWNMIDPDERLLDTVIGWQEMVRQEFLSNPISGEQEPYLVLYSPVKIGQTQYTLMIRSNMLESEDFVRTIGLLYFLVIAVLLAGLVLVSKAISKRLWKPFYDTLEKVETFDIQSQQPISFSATAVAEFQQMNDALGKLIEHNIDAFRLQKEFTENASHELQTPLAIFRSKLDMLLQDPDITEAQAQLIHALYQAASRLGRLNKNLLLLAKIENRQFPDMVQLNVGQVIQDCVDEMSDLAISQEIHIQMTLEEDAGTVTANKGLLEILFDNLIANAIRHNVPGGNILIKTHRQRIDIGNRGAETALPSDILFKRFSKSSDSGSGLGLAIVNQICRQYGWHLSYRFEKNMHWFSIFF